MAMVNMKPPTSRNFKADSAASILCCNHTIEFFHAESIGVTTICASSLTPLASTFDDFFPLTSVPIFRLSAATGLASRVSALRPLLENTKGVERFLLAAEIAYLHGHTAAVHRGSHQQSGCNNRILALYPAASQCAGRYHGMLHLRLDRRARTAVVSLTPFFYELDDK